MSRRPALDGPFIRTPMYKALCSSRLRTTFQCSTLRSARRRHADLHITGAHGSKSKTQQSGTDCAQACTWQCMAVKSRICTHSAPVLIVQYFIIKRSERVQPLHSRHDRVGVNTAAQTINAAIKGWSILKSELIFSESDRMDRTRCISWRLVSM